MLTIFCVFLLTTHKLRAMINLTSLIAPAAVYNEEYKTDKKSCAQS